jgi:hypothetical protein
MTQPVPVLPLLGYSLDLAVLIVALLALWWNGQHPEDWIEPWCRGDHKKDM